MADAILLPVAQMLCNSATVVVCLLARYHQVTAIPCDTAIWTKIPFREIIIDSHAAGLGRCPPSMTLWPLKKSKVIHERKTFKADPTIPMAPRTGKRRMTFALRFLCSSSSTQAPGGVRIHGTTKLSENTQKKNHIFTHSTINNYLKSLLTGPLPDLISFSHLSGISIILARTSTIITLLYSSCNSSFNSSISLHVLLRILCLIMFYIPSIRFKSGDCGG